MRSTMMDVPLSLNHLLERAGRLFAGNANVRFLVVDDILLPLYRQFANLHAF
jgi:fatty-acyl-CoA synthase